MRLLIVEDDVKISNYLAKGLREEGYAVDVAGDGIDGLHLALVESYDTAIVDLMLPGLDGLSLIERLRKRGLEIPVLILSAKQSVDDRVHGLQSGGDDYLTKPFSFSELLARVQALIRRSSKNTEIGSELNFEDLTLNLLQRTVSRGGKELVLQAKEFSLLEFFLRNPRRVVSKTAILEHVYDYAFDPRTNVVDVLVHRLRKKVDEEFDRKLIQTVRGAGYALR